MNDVWVASHLLLWVTVVVQGIVILALLRQVGSLLLRVGSIKAIDAQFGPEIGSKAPKVEEIEAASSGSDKMTLLSFLSTTCGDCAYLVPALNAAASSYSSRVQVLALGRESSVEVHRWAAKQRLRVASISSPDAFEAFGIDGTPYAFVLDSEGWVVGRGGVNHIEHLESLLRTCCSSQESDVDGVKPLTELTIGAKEG